MLSESISKVYTNADANHFIKDGKPTRAVKIYFSDPKGPADATVKGIFLDACRLRVRVDICKDSKGVIQVQCYNCRRFGHIALRCVKPKTCPECGTQHENNGDCALPKACTNCNGDHSAKDWSRCQTYQDKINQNRHG